MTQPKALFLADVLHNDPASKSHHDEAAFELRRLHAENERLWFENGDLRRCSQLEEVERYAAANRKYAAQRDALLEALRTLLSYATTLEMRLLDADGEHRAMRIARAAIAKAEGQQT